MLPREIVEAIEEAGFPLPVLEYRTNQSKQGKYEDMEEEK